MIKGKYKVFGVFKETQYKRLERAAKSDGNVVMLKSYTIAEGRLAQNEVKTYQKIKQGHLSGFPEIKEAFE
jgi:hypothetical protein